MKPTVCFVALKSYAVFARDSAVRHIGGAEVQQSLLARELARRGYRVNVAVLDHGQRDRIEIDGVRLFKAYRPEAGVRGLRFFYPRLTKLWSAMTCANADIYYQRGGEAETGLAAAWCLRNRRRFVFAIAHDANCDPEMRLLEGPAERALFRYGLRHADVVIAQTCHQQRLLREAFGIESVLVRSCCAFEQATETWPADGFAGSRILWVGRLSPEKRPEWLLALVRELPACRFDVVGQCNSHSSYGRGLAAQLASLSNVAWHGYVPRESMGKFYRRATVLLCTSKSEGFPNAFLEAWACGIPVVSSVDPDGVINRHALGRVGRTCDELKACLLALSGNSGECHDFGRNAVRYVAEHHSIDASVTALERVFSTLLSPTGGPAAVSHC